MNWKSSSQKASAHSLLAVVVFSSAILPQFSLAQGTVTFGNRVTTNSVLALLAPVYLGSPRVGNGPSGVPAGTQDWSGFTFLAGSNYRAQLFAAPGVNQPESAMVAVSPVTTFRTGSAAGTIPTTVVTLVNIPADAEVATFQLRAWDSHNGDIPTWSDAVAEWAVGRTYAGKSVPFEVHQIGGTINPAPLLDRLESFSIYLNYWPEILVQPQSQTLPLGATAYFRVLAACQAPMAYQWFHNNLEIPGATDEALTIPSVDQSDEGDYTLRVLGPGPAGTVFSSPAALSVLGKPSILVQPKAQTVVAGTPASFSVTAVGALPLTYQWQFFGTNLPVASASTLAIPNAQLPNSGIYQVIVTNYLGSITSSPARLQVVAAVLNSYGAIEVEFLTGPNTSYYLQASPDLNTWTNVEGPILGNGQPWSKLYSTRGKGKLYYRVELAP